MKLRKITIKDYRILHDFSIEFNNQDDKQGYAIDLIVGVNGTGKSTLLRLLASIFQQLEKGNATIPFGFAVSYQLAGDSSPLISISNLSDDESEIRQDKCVVFRQG